MFQDKKNYNVLDISDTEEVDDPIYCILCHDMLVNVKSDFRLTVGIIE